MLDAPAAIELQIFLDLAGVAGVLVDRDPDFSIGAGQRPREQTRRAAFDIEETNLTEVEQFCVKSGPDIHAAAMDVVGEVIEIIKPGAFGTGIFGAQPLELGFVSRALGAIAVDEIKQTAADAFDGGHIERLLHGRNVGGFPPQPHRAPTTPLPPPPRKTPPPPPPPR